MQNPQWAGGEGVAQERATNLIESGEEIRSARAQMTFPTAGESSAYSMIFKDLYWQNKDKYDVFPQQAESLTSRAMNNGRPFNLWGNVESNWSDLYNSGKLHTLPGAPSTMGTCNSGWDPVPTNENTAYVNNISHALMFDRWANNARVEICYRNAGLQEVNTATQCQPGNWCFRRHYYRLHVDLTHSVVADGGLTPHPPITAKDGSYSRDINFDDNDPRIKCEWWGFPDTPMPTDRCKPYFPNLLAELGKSKQPLFANGGGPTVDPNAGATQMTQMISDRRALYYDIMANEINQDSAAIPVVHDLNNYALLWRAYVQTVLPRTFQSNDRLRLKLYGPQSLLANTPVTVGKNVNPILTNVYREAAQKQRANGLNLDGPMMLDLLKDTQIWGQPEPLDCAAFRTPQKDAIAECVRQVGTARASSVWSQTPHHKRSQGELQVETPPLIDEALDNLHLARQYARTKYPKGYPPHD